MKGKVLTGVLVALLVIPAMTYAQANASMTLTAKVPFAFQAGSVSLPAGDYTLYEYPTGVILIAGAKSYQCLSLTSPGKSPGDDDSLRLIFHRYDDQYFLSEVVNGTQFASRRFPVSKLEKEQMQAVSSPVARHSQRTEVTVVASLR